MLAGYDEEQLAVILDFLRQSTRLFQEEAVKLAKLSQSGA
jgi:hypothetical protein